MRNFIKAVDWPVVGAMLIGAASAAIVVIVIVKVLG